MTECPPYGYVPIRYIVFLRHDDTLVTFTMNALRRLLAATLFLCEFFGLTLQLQKCNYDSSKVTRVLGTPSSTERGVRYGLISTPNFPHPFDAPLTRRWIIDASAVSFGNYTKTGIYLYLTQVYLTEGISIAGRQQDPLECVHHEDYADTMNRVRTRRDAGKNDVVQNARILYTESPYLEISLHLPSLYSSHLRTKNAFTHNFYGFNISYEIVPNTSIRKNPCSFKNCSYLGTCYASQELR